jgi:hypothetical protein
VPANEVRRGAELADAVSSWSLNVNIHNAVMKCLFVLVYRVIARFVKTVSCNRRAYTTYNIYIYIYLSFLARPFKSFHFGVSNAMRISWDCVRSQLGLLLKNGIAEFCKDRLKHKFHSNSIDLYKIKVKSVREDCQVYIYIYREREIYIYIYNVSLVRAILLPNVN